MMFILNVLVILVCCFAAYGLYRFEVEKTNARKERRERDRQLMFNFKESIDE